MHARSVEQLKNTPFLETQFAYGHLVYYVILKTKNTNRFPEDFYYRQNVTI